jgi:nucleotide-binding universal stress UspA family protein
LAIKLGRVLGQDLQTKMLAGDAANPILDAAEEGGEPSLIAVGSRGHGMLDRLALGSVSDKIMRAAAGPVLIYRQPPTEADARTEP